MIHCSRIQYQSWHSDKSASAQHKINTSTSLHFATSKKLTSSVTISRIYELWMKNVYENVAVSYNYIYVTVAKIDKARQISHSRMLSSSPLAFKNPPTVTSPA